MNEKVISERITHICVYIFCVFILQYVIDVFSEDFFFKLTKLQ